VPSDGLNTGPERLPTKVVELENSSWVVPRGVCHTEWFIRLGDVWTRIADVPSASAIVAGDESGQSDADGFVIRRPGCQYLCRYRLLLPVGTAVRRRVSRPRDARPPSRSTETVSVDLRRDILTYFRFTKPPLRVVETNFRVTRGGLVSDAQWERVAARRASGAR
jgi:hypothetical protein